MSPITRADFSMYLVHFTKDHAPISANKHPDDVKDIVPLTAKERLLALLQQCCIRATRMPWTDSPAVCFTECTWPSLLAHAEHYSPYGVGFRKEFIFSAGGGPAFYMPPHLLERQKKLIGKGKPAFDPEVYAFLTPFAPEYATTAYKKKHWPSKVPIDFTHEREWRVPHDLTFNLRDVSFVIVDAYTDMAQAPKVLKDTIGRDKWLIIANYRKVEELWPIHVLP